MIAMNSPSKQSKKIKRRSWFNIKTRAGPLMALTVYISFTANSPLKKGAEGKGKDGDEKFKKVKQKLNYMISCRCKYLFVSYMIKLDKSNDQGGKSISNFLCQRIVLHIKCSWKWSEI